MILNEGEFVESVLGFEVFEEESGLDTESMISFILFISLVKDSISSLSFSISFS